MSDRIIRVLHCCYALAGGGAEKQLRLLINASPRADMKPAIHCVDTFGISENEAKCQIYQYRRKRKLDLGIVRDVNRVIRVFEPDVVHVWLPPVITIPSMLATAFHGIPCVFSYRSAMRFRTLQQVPEFLAMLALTNKIVTNNPIKNSSSIFRWAYRAKSGEQIDNAVDPLEIAGPPVLVPERLSRVILFVGRVTVEKNWPCLLQAFALLRNSGSHQLLICGVGDQQKKMLKMIGALGLEGAVKLLGYRPDATMLMRTADAVVLPSLWEGNPNVALEASAAGAPLVLSDIEAHASYKKVGAAWMFDPKSPESLARCLEDLFRNPATALTAREAGRQLVLNRSPDVMAAQYRVAYLDSIARARDG